MSARATARRLLRGPIRAPLPNGWGLAELNGTRYAVKGETVYRLGLFGIVRREKLPPINYADSK